MFLGAFLYAVLTILLIKVVMGITKDKFLGIISSHSNTERLEAGKDKPEERAKILEKKRAEDPMNANRGNGGNASPTNTPYGQPQIPDMRGMDYGNSGSMGPVSGIGGGFGVNAMVGVVNAVGISEQGGDIKNISLAGRHITGPVRQMGMVYNMKPKGTKSIQQAGSTIFNTIRQGSLTMNQNASTIKTSIADGRTDVKPLGSSSNYISGDIQSLTAGGGDIYTPNLKINGISKVGSLNAQKFTAPKNMRAKIQKLNEMNHFNQEVIEGEASEQQLSLDSGKTEKRPNVVLSVNTVNLLNAGNKKYVSSTENLTKTLSLEQAFSESQNGELSRDQLVTLAAVYRQIYKMNVSNNGNYQNILKQAIPSMNSNFQNMLQQVVRAEPNVKNPEVIIEAAFRTPKMWEKDKKQPREALASLMTNKRNVQRDLLAQNMNYLNNGIIRNDGIANSQYNHEVDKAYRKEVEQRAMENLEKRSDMSLEDKEKEYEIEVKKLMGSENEEDRKLVEERLKQQVLADPEEAKRVLGEAGATKLKQHMEQEEEKVYQRNLEKQEKIADSAFVKSNPGYENAGENETREARTKAEIQDTIHKVVKEIYDEKEKERERKIPSFDEYRKRRGIQDEQYHTNTQGNIPQPTGSASIYIPRAVQEQMARRVSNSD